MRRPLRAHRTRAAIAALAAVLVVALTATSCASPAATSIRAQRAVAPTSTPTPAPTPTLAPTPTVAPTATPVPQPAALAPRSALDPAARSWPPELAASAEFVATVRGPFSWEAPDVVYLGGEQLAERLRASGAAFDPTHPSIREAIERGDDAMRALGLTTREFALDEVSDFGAGTLLGAYDWTSHELLIRLESDREPSTALEELDVRETAVHEIAHAWQGRDRIVQMQIASRNDIDVAQALIEGEAEWVTAQWLAALDPTDAEDLHVNTAQLIDRGLEDIPGAVLADSLQPYTLGLRLYEAVHRARGLIGFDQMITGSRLVSGRALIDPHGWSIGAGGSHTWFEPIPAPTGTRAVAYVGASISGPEWFRIFATTSELPLALDAARATRSTSVPSVWVAEGGTTCIGLDADFDTGSAAVEQAFDAWAAAMPGNRSAERSADGVWQVSACDPGPEAVPVPRSDPYESLEALARLIDAETWALDRGLTADVGRCAALPLIASGVDRAVTTTQWHELLDRVDSSTCAG